MVHLLWLMEFGVMRCLLSCFVRKTFRVSLEAFFRFNKCHLHWPLFILLILMSIKFDAASNIKHEIYCVIVVTNGQSATRKWRHSLRTPFKSKESKPFTSTLSVCVRSMHASCAAQREARKRCEFFFIDFNGTHNITASEWAHIQFHYVNMFDKREKI